MPAAPVSGLALRMRRELERLRIAHGVAAPEMLALPLAEPIEGDVLVSGYASTPDTDQARQAFRLWSLSWQPFGPLPPLLFRHAEPAGELQELQWTRRGLWVRALVRHSEAKRAAGFSVGATVTKYRIEDAGSPNYRAVIETGELLEISLTPSPCNSRAVVASRTPVPPTTKFYDLTLERIQCLQQLAGLLQRGIRV